MVSEKSCNNLHHIMQVCNGVWQPRKSHSHPPPCTSCLCANMGWRGGGGLFAHSRVIFGAHTEYWFCNRAPAGVMYNLCKRQSGFSAHIRLHIWQETNKRAIISTKQKSRQKLAAFPGYKKGLTLGELLAPTGFAQTNLLPLNLTRVACNQTSLT